MCASHSITDPSNFYTFKYELLHFHTLLWRVYAVNEEFQAKVDVSLLGLSYVANTLLN